MPTSCHQKNYFIPDVTLSWQKRKKSKRISYDCRDLETQVKPLKARKVKPANILPNRAILSTLYDKFTTNVQIVHSTLNSRANYCTRYPLCRTNLLLLLYRTVHNSANYINLDPLCRTNIPMIQYCILQYVHSTVHNRANYCTLYPLCRTKLPLMLYGTVHNRDNNITLYPLCSVGQFSQPRIPLATPGLTSIRS